MYANRNAIMTIRFVFLLNNSRALIRCTGPLRRGVGAPNQCPLGVGSEL